MDKRMKLNIFTPLFRSGMIKKVADSIPDYEDINWIVVIAKHREILIKECQAYNIPYLTVDCIDDLSGVGKKVNKALDNLQDGFFFGLDDDTTFNHNTYDIFKRYQNDYDMIVGQQRLLDGGIRIAQKPTHCHTDGAQGLIRTTLIDGLRFGCFTTDPVADCNFLLNCWDKSNKNLILDEIISNYNFLR